MKKTTEQRLTALEEQVKNLRAWHLDHESNRHLGAMAQRIANRLFELGSERVDLHLIAKLNAALGCDVMPLTKKAPKRVRKYATKGVKAE
jgi:hypothetical protein